MHILYVYTRADSYNETTWNLLEFQKFLQVHVHIMIYNYYIYDSYLSMFNKSPGEDDPPCAPP
jgi:hypothetical protein